MDISEFSNKICKNYGMKLYPLQSEILNRFYNEKYRELVAVLGRRAGKDFLSAILALFEAKNLLTKDDPFKYYKIAKGSPIFIFVICCSSNQARILLTQIKEMLNIFDELKVGAVEADKIYLLTHEDEQRAKMLKKGKNTASEVKGSVVIMSAHSNSESLLGKRIYTLLLNEVAWFKTTGGVTSGDRIYSALGPATADFINPETGKLDSKIITISSPRREDEILPRLYTRKRPSQLSVKYPTWEINPFWSKEKLRKEFQFMSDEDFDTEFGAEFLPNTENQTISIRLPGSTINTVKRMARAIAFKEDKDYSYIDIIRSSIDHTVKKYVG